MIASQAADTVFNIIVNLSGLSKGIVFNPLLKLTAELIQVIITRHVFYLDVERFVLIDEPWVGIQLYTKGV